MELVGQLELPPVQVHGAVGGGGGGDGCCPLAVANVAVALHHLEDFSSLGDRHAPELQLHT